MTPELPDYVLGGSRRNEAMRWPGHHLPSRLNQRTIMICRPPYLFLSTLTSRDVVQVSEAHRCHFVLARTPTRSTLWGNPCPAVSRKPRSWKTLFLLLVCLSVGSDGCKKSGQNSTKKFTLILNLTPIPTLSKMVKSDRPSVGEIEKNKAVGGKRGPISRTEEVAPRCRYQEGGTKAHLAVH